MSDVSNPSKHSSESPRKITKPTGDCISSLPDTILQHILSYITTKFAIRTSVLSKRWKHVWCDTPSLFIEGYLVDPSSIIKTLSNYTAPKITIFDASIRSNATASQIDIMIKLIMSRNPENFSFKFKTHDYIFPECFYISSSVKQQSLVSVYNIFPTCTVSWTSLRKFSLRGCKLSDESLAKILSGCPMLESLVLFTCVALYRLDLSKSLSLKSLEIFSNGWFPGVEEIVAPHIHYLKLTNSSKPFALVDVSSLTEANLNIDYFTLFFFGHRFGFLQDMVLTMLAKLQNIDKLTIGVISLQILSLAEIRGIPFPQLKIKALTLETMINRSVIPSITRLLQNSPELKKITVNTMKCNAVTGEKIDGYLKTQGLMNPDQCWSWKYGVNFPMDDADAEDVASFMNFFCIRQRL